MKNKYALLFVLFSIAGSLLHAQNADKKYALLLLSGTVYPAENGKELSSLKIRTDEAVNGKYYRIVQFMRIPSDAEKAELQSMGIELLQYLPSMAYFAAVDKATVWNTANARGNIRAVLSVSSEYKIHPSLKNNNLPADAEVEKGKADLTISYFKGIPGSVLVNELKSAISGLQVLEQDEEAQVVRVRVARADAMKLADLSVVQYVEPIDPWKLENNTGTTEHRSNTINNFITGGLRYDGTGVGVSVGDGGAYFSHIDFKGRNTGGVLPGADHGTHVAGTLGGAGNINPKYKGQAPGAFIIYSNGFADISSTTTATNLYNGTNKIRVTNHSLGQTLNAGYTSDARQSDLLVQSLPSMFNIHSAGNSGSGWNTITGGYKVGKNCITTAALDYKDVVTSFSSRGPSADGRIKPDVAAKGDAVQSTMPNNAYGGMSGTSMSAPGNAGCFTQLIHAYRDLNAGADPKLGALKCIVLNTAQDLGNVGPDYTYGWGRVNVWKAYNAIKNQRYFSSSIGDAQSKTHVITVPANVAEMKVMVYWTDPAAAAGVSKALINDLDITVSSSSQTYDPWLLDSGSPGTAATKGQDNDNNMEQVTVAAPAAGTYTLNVLGYTVPTGPQEYWVSYEFIMDEIKVTYPIGGESVVPAETEYIRWDAYGSTTGTFLVEYSTDGGATWANVSAAVGGGLRFVGWAVPSTVTGKAMVRVSRNGKSDVSDTTFNIIRVPTALKIDWRCKTAFQLSWTAATGATAYEVYLLGPKYMESQGTTTNLNFFVNSLNTAATWASVRALADNGQTIGRRAIAIKVDTTTNCPPPTFVEALGEPVYGLSVSPNPMSERSIVSAFLPDEDVVSVMLIDVFGKEVATIAESQKLSAGEHLFTVESVPSEGIYFVVIRGSGGSSFAKLVVTRD